MPAEERDRHSTGEGTIASREIGMGIGFHVARHFLKTEHLHYGLWPDDLPADLKNIAQAQAAYTDALLAEIPDDVKSVLDVGCGGGATALELLERGYEVDCVVQRGPLADIAREKLAGRANLYEVAFQEFVTDRTYDLLLFSESLLFIRPLSVALERAFSVLREDGYLLVTDIFRRMSEDDSDPRGLESYHRGSIGGGHHLWEFREAVASYPLELVRETDVTDRIAPTFQILGDTLEALRPAYDLWMQRLHLKRPLVLKFARWFLKLEKYEGKWFGGRYSAANFKRDKSYWRFLYRRLPEASGSPDREQ